MSDNKVNNTINLDGNANSELNEFNKTLENVFENIEKTKKSFKNTFDAAFTVIEKATQGFKVLAGSSLDFEQQTKLKAQLNGDAAATKNLVSQIREYGKATAYSSIGLMEAQNTMLSLGLNSEFALSKLKNIGDIALGDSQNMQTLAQAFARATNSGKLLGQDLSQMINAGFNPLEVISQKTGKSMSDLNDEMSKGKISSDMLAQSLQWATEEGGKFYQGAETASQTTSGRIANMKNKIEEMKLSLFEATNGATAYIAEVGQTIIPLLQLSQTFSDLGTAISKVKMNWNGLVNNFKGGIFATCMDIGLMKESTNGIGSIFSLIGRKAGLMCKGIGIAIKSIPVVGWIITIISLLIGIFKILWDKSEGFRRLVMGIWEVFKAVLNNIWVVIKGIFTGIYEVIKSIISPIIDAFSMLWDGIVNVATSIGEFFSEAWETVCNAFGSAIDWIKEKLGSVGTWIHDNLIQPIIDAFNWLWENVKDIFKKILEKVGKIFAPLKALWNKLFPKDQFKDLKEAYSEGAEKGSESWKEDQEKKKKERDSKKEDPANKANDKANEFSKNTTTQDGKSKAETIATGGNRNTSININIHSIVDKMQFENGGFETNKESIVAQVEEAFLRVLYAAQTAQ